MVPQTGRIVSLSAQVGQPVRAGQALAVVDQTLDATQQIGLSTERANAQAELRAATIGLIAAAKVWTGTFGGPSLDGAVKAAEAALAKAEELGGVVIVSRKSMAYENMDQRAAYQFFTRATAWVIANFGEWVEDHPSWREFLIAVKQIDPDDTEQPAAEAVTEETE